LRERQSVGMIRGWGGRAIHAGGTAGGAGPRSRREVGAAGTTTVFEGRRTMLRAAARGRQPSVGDGAGFSGAGIGARADTPSIGAPFRGRGRAGGRWPDTFVGARGARRHGGKRYVVGEQASERRFAQQEDFFFELGAIDRHVVGWRRARARSGGRTAIFLGRPVPSGGERLWSAPGMSPGRSGARCVHDAAAAARR